MALCFTRKELERLNCSEEEILLIMEYQRGFPILLDDDKNMEKFCIDARELYREIIQSDDMSHFSRWFSRAIKNYKFAENVDFTPIRPIGRDVREGGDIKSIQYFLTLDTAKQIAMIDKKESGFVARKYFILMERIVKENKEWLEIRDPEKAEYNKMSAEVDAWCYRIWNHSASRSEYAVEADMINIIVTSKTSRDLKCELHISTNDMLRDYLKKEYNEELLFLEMQNQVLLQMDMGFTERKNLLTQMYKARFKK